MARFYFDGVDGIEMSLSQLANMTEDEKRVILNRGAEVFKEKLAEVLDRLGLRDTGQLIEHISQKDKNRSGNPVAAVSSYGKRKKGYTGKRKDKRGRSKGSYSGTNTELLYLLEYGTPRMKAYHPIETAENEADEAVTAAMAEAWDEYLTSKNL